MKEFIHIQQMLVPDLIPMMKRRYEALYFVKLMQPVGRRTLSSMLGLTERVLRSEVTFLKEQGLLHIETSGMSITEQGNFVLQELEWFFRDFSGLNRLETSLKEMLQVEQVIVVQGDSDESDWVKKELGQACITCIKKYASAQNIVAVTGGTTMAAVADLMTPEPSLKDLLFVPARGGLGEHVENQANTICAKMAEKAKAQYRLLHVPEQVSEEVYETLIEEPSIKSVLDLIRRSNIIIHGIGDATTMASRRKSENDVINRLKNGDAIGEAFGYYFDINGEIIHRVNTVGVQLEEIANVPHLISIAGGKSKAKAIEAFFRFRSSGILITDEGAAKQLLRDFPLT